MNHNIKYIEENAGDYDDLEKQTDSIACNLKTIADDETDLDRLEAQLDRIIAKLGRRLGGAMARQGRLNNERTPHRKSERVNHQDAHLHARAKRRTVYFY